MDISCSDQARRKKARKAIRQAESPIERSAGASKSTGPLHKEITVAKKRVLSAVGRAAIIRGAKKRWAKVRKQAKRTVS
jgi:hypothetical protein